MKNKSFFYQQYAKIHWENQEKTKINSFIYNFIIKKIILKRKNSDIKVFDMGFGIGFFLKMLNHDLSDFYKNIVLEGCEPSNKNYNYFKKKSFDLKENIKLKTYNKTFLSTKTDEKFDFITSIYVFPSFIFEEIEETVKKIYSMLESKGKFVLVVSNEKFLKEKLKTEKDLFIEENIIEWGGKKYKEFLHYADIPEIGKIIDYNREESFYLDLFKKNKFKLIQKENLNDEGFVCTIFIFEKK